MAVLRGGRRASDVPPPPSLPSPGPLPQGRPAEVRAAEIIAGPLGRLADAAERIAGALAPALEAPDSGAHAAPAGYDGP